MKPICCLNDRNRSDKIRMKNEINEKSIILIARLKDDNCERLVTSFNKMTYSRSLSSNKIIENCHQQFTLKSKVFMF